MAEKVPKLVLVRSPVATRERDPDCLRAAGVRVDHGQLCSGRQRYALRELADAELQHSAPRVMVPMMAALSMVVVGLPLLESRMVRAQGSTTTLIASLLVGSALFFFGSLMRFLNAQDQYWVVLRTERGARKLFQSEDRSVASGAVERLKQLISHSR